MRITNAQVVVCSPGQNYVTLRVETDAGIHGLGDASLNGRELAVAAYLNDHVIPLLIDRDPFDTEATWQYLYRGAYWPGGPVGMTAVSAVDVALWDIKGKALETPLYDLLGGTSRRAVPAYVHAHGPLDTAIAEVARHQQAGFTAVRVQPSIPGLPGSYRELHAEPAPAPRGDLPPEEAWDTERYLAFIPQAFATLRDRFPDLKLLHDPHNRLTPIEAAWLGKRLEDSRLLWLEDPVRGDLQEGYRLIRRHTSIPLAAGETFSSIYDCHRLIVEQLIDFVRMSTVHGGGLTHLRKVAAIAEVYDVQMACHGPIDVSPVSTAAALHFGLATHNVAIQEYVPHSEQTAAVFSFGYKVVDGSLYPGDAPGLGVDLDVEAAAKYPYQRSYLPVLRKRDGTIHPW